MSAELRRHDPLAFAGRVEMRTHESEVLRGNPLGDPHVREVPIYVPPGADAPAARFPVLFFLSGFTGRGQYHLETHPWRRGPVALYDRAVADGHAAPAILVLPDCFTGLGGSQYVNSPAVGRYQDHVLEELVPLVDRHYPVLPGRRGIVGKSSGGIGALHLCMQAPGTFAACASISGDCGFEVGMPHEFHSCLRGLVPYGGDPARFLERFRNDHELKGDDHAVILTLAMSACYSPNPRAPLGFDLPFDLRTGELVEDVWKRWLEFDPVYAVARHAEALRGLELLHIECGLADEFNLQWSARRLVDRLIALDIPHVYEEHEGSHRGIDHRYLPVLDRLARVLRG